MCPGARIGQIGIYGAPVCLWATVELEQHPAENRREILWHPSSLQPCRAHYDQSQWVISFPRHLKPQDPPASFSDCGSPRIPSQKWVYARVRGRGLWEFDQSLLGNSALWCTFGSTRSKPNPAAQRGGWWSLLMVYSSGSVPGGMCWVQAQHFYDLALWPGVNNCALLFFSIKWVWQGPCHWVVKRINEWMWKLCKVSCCNNALLSIVPAPPDPLKILWSSKLLLWYLLFYRVGNRG